MALTDPYTTVAEFRARVGSIEDVADVEILTVLLSASRQIEGVCGQVFNKVGTATVKYITPVYGELIDLPPFVSVSELATDNGDRTYPTIWATTDYDLFPYDAVDLSVPYTQIHVSPVGRYGWPNLVRGVRVTGIWGWPAVPTPVKEACFLLANRGKSLWAAPFGQTGVGELGSGLNMTAALTPLIREMLGQYKVITT